MQSSEAGFAVPISTQQAPIASPFAATVQRALSGALSFDAREVPLTKLTQQLSLNLAESRARGSLKQPAKSGTPCALEMHRWIATHLHRDVVCSIGTAKAASAKAAMHCAVTL